MGFVILVHLLIDSLYTSHDVLQHQFLVCFAVLQCALHHLNLVPGCKVALDYNVSSQPAIVKDLT